MADEQTEAYDALYAYARVQIAAGIPDDQLQLAIVQQGWTPEIASTIISNLHAQKKLQKRRKVREAALRDLLIGGAVCLLGTVVTIFTYSAAKESGGGRYMIAWGAILFGGIQFLKGLAGFAA